MLHCALHLSQTFTALQPQLSACLIIYLVNYNRCLGILLVNNMCIMSEH